MKHRAKFSKTKCKTCAYHGSITGIATGTIYCNYGAIAESSCLYRGKHGEVLDRRGDDRFNCKLYMKGAKIRDKQNWQESNRLWKGENIDG